MSPKLLHKLGLNGHIGPFNPRPCWQLRASPHHDPANHPFIFLFGHQGLPFDHKGLPFGHQGLPFGHQGLPFGHQGLPFSHQGLPFGHQGLPFDHQGLPFGHKGLPFGFITINFIQLILLILLILLKPKSVTSLLTDGHSPLFN